jgi:hypothetical protein
MKAVISFSMRVKMVLNGIWSGQRTVTISRRLRMFAVLNILVSMAAMRYVVVNRAAPMISWIRLGKMGFGRGVKLDEIVRLMDF